MDEDLVEAVEEHRFEPLDAAKWRNAKLDFSSLPGLLRSLAPAAERARAEAGRRGAWTR